MKKFLEAFLYHTFITMPFVVGACAYHMYQSWKKRKGDQ